MCSLSLHLSHACMHTRTHAHTQSQVPITNRRHPARPGLRSQSSAFLGIMRALCQCGMYRINVVIHTSDILSIIAPHDMLECVPHVMVSCQILGYGNVCMCHLMFSGEIPEVISIPGPSGAMTEVVNYIVWGQCDRMQDISTILVTRFLSYIYFCTTGGGTYCNLLCLFSSSFGNIDALELVGLKTVKHSFVSVIFIPGRIFLFYISYHGPQSESQRTSAQIPRP